MADEILLNEAAGEVWVRLDAIGRMEVRELARATQLDQSQVMAIATEAASQGYFKFDERDREELTVADSARGLIDAGLPEVRAAKRLHEAGGQLSMSDAASWAKSEGIAINDAIKWGTTRGAIERIKTDKGAALILTETGKRLLQLLDADLRLLDRLDYQGSIYLDELTDDDDPKRIHVLLSKRPELARIRNRTERVVSITNKGSEVFKSSVRKILERNTLTPEDLESGAWREIKLRPYDVTLAARDVYPAKIHPLRKIIEQTRRAFLEMGFAEVASPMIESAFWNFDALFQPQDHPARDMQDTFYMRWPTEAPLPGEKGDGSLLPERPGGFAQKTPVPFFASDIVEQVRRTHEDGWETGSEGWGYKWSPERSKQVVLRTHTTAATIRALAANPNPPGRFFCVGWTYRNETISFKHLPVFHQVDGIVVDEEANLASLMGTLQEFYSKMGFGRVKFKPAFYPYTEPSVDVVVYMESRKKWLEMGGAGIFRPEVTLPLGCNWPVLAWGLGIERLAMLRFGLDDIRDLYGTNLDALQQVPLCR
jgi:phenylalanyl-tRNA synthetase alpha chain